MRHSLSSILVLGWVLTAGPALLAGEVNLTPAKDNTLYENATGALSNGAGERFFAGRTGAGLIRRGLLAFDVTGSIPPGSTVTGATLTLSLVQTSVGPQAVGLHRADADWGEGTSDAAGGEGGGTASTPGDATWIHAFFDTALWSDPGGDFVATPSASTVVDQPAAYVWSTTSTMVADVQSWLDAPASNAGWVLVGNESTFPTSKSFASGDNPDTGLHPVLNVQFTDPVPTLGQWGLITLSAALLGVGLWRIRRTAIG